MIEEVFKEDNFSSSLGKENKDQSVQNHIQEPRPNRQIAKAESEKGNN
jgi:hypothetical protein